MKEHTLTSRLAAFGAIACSVVGAFLIHDGIGFLAISAWLALISLTIWKSSK